MPKSKSKRRRYQPPARPKPKPSPSWYTYAVLGPIGAGFALIIVNYFGIIWETSNPALWVGIALIAIGFGLATRWR